MSDLIYLGTRKGLIPLSRGANGWRLGAAEFLGHSVSMLMSDPRDEFVYAALNLGHFGVKLHRSADRGKSWNECSVPVYPEGAEIGGGPFVEEGQPTTQPASLKEIWELCPGGSDQPGWIWAGTIPGGLFLSQDRGDSWTLVESLWNREERMDWFGGGKDEPGIHSICVDPQDSKHLTLGISCGGVWETHDGGVNWTLIGEGLRAEFMPPNLAFERNVQDVHRLVQCHQAPEMMWIQHHNGIFGSVNAGLNWSEFADVSPSAFGFAVGVHPADGKTAWFVPGVKDECRVPVDGQLVVIRTRDGGETFETLREGLPQENCYDIVYRHALDVDETGERIVMGSSTGGVWISEDGGDHWITVSNTLPPIYCARFAG